MIGNTFHGKEVATMGLLTASYGDGETLASAAIGILAKGPPPADPIESQLKRMQPRVTHDGETTQVQVVSMQMKVCNN